jgi:hypothetical protein
MMDKVQKLSNLEYYTQSSEPLKPANIHSLSGIATHNPRVPSVQSLMQLTSLVVARFIWLHLSFY